VLPRMVITDTLPMPDIYTLPMITDFLRFAHEDGLYTTEDRKLLPPKEGHLRRIEDGPIRAESRVQRAAARNGVQTMDFG